VARVESKESTWSFDQIYDEYKTPIYNYVYHLVGDREQADDLTQDTFLKAFRALPKMDGNLKLSAWLYRIATNTAYDALRRRKLIAWLPWQDLDACLIDSQQPEILCDLVHHAGARRNVEHQCASHRHRRETLRGEGSCGEDLVTDLIVSESAERPIKSDPRDRWPDMVGLHELICLGSRSQQCLPVDLGDHVLAATDQRLLGEQLEKP